MNCEGNAMTKIKLCGMSRVEDIAACNLLKPDYVGFINLFPKSHRNIDFQTALMLRSMLDDSIPSIGVFVDREIKEITPYLLSNVINGIQLHGQEDNEYIRNLRAVTPSYVPIIKAFKIRSEDDLEKARNSTADYVLLDNGTGTGETFDWNLIRDFPRPYFLAGGLAPDNLREAIERFHPYAVDISSGIETDKLKDPSKMEECLKIVRSFD